jgi:hypothetical protein
VVGRANKLVFNDIKERVAKRIHGWKERFLSKAGREILIKAVAQAIPTYSMSCFLLPKTWCSDLNGMMAKYWWGQQDTARKIHWVKWESMCTDKSVGGLGFKKLHLFNRVLLAKQGWRLLQAPHSLFGQLFKAKYFPSCSFLEASLGSNPSYLWRSILAGWEVLKKGVDWQHQIGGPPRPI